MDLFREQRADVLLPLALLALLIAMGYRTRKPGRQAWWLAAIQLPVIWHHWVASYSDHTETGVLLRFGVAIVATILAVWAMVQPIKCAIKAAKTGSFKPVVPLARTGLFTLAWSLAAMVYLFVLCQAWFILALAVRRYMDGYGQTGNGLDNMAAVIYSVTGGITSALIWAAYITTPVVLLLLVVHWWAKRRDKKRAAAAKATAKKAAPPPATTAKKAPAKKAVPSKKAAPPTPPPATTAAPAPPAAAKKAVPTRIWRSKP